MTNQGLSRNSHIVPQFLIARFGDANGRVLVHDKETKAEALRNPKSLIERDFYMINTGKGPSDVVEKHIGQKIEAPAATAMQNIDAGEWPPSEQNRARLALFMAVQLNRGKEFRELMNRLAEEQRKGIVEPLNPELGKELLDAISDAAAEEAMRIGKSKEFQIKSMLDAAPQIARLLYERHWILLTGNGFLTGDMPISKWEEGGHVGYDIGVAVADEILMPISTGAAILLVPPTNPAKGIGQFAMPAAGVAQARALMWETAQQFTYRHPDTPSGTA